MPAISPKEARKRQMAQIPEAVFDAFNKLLSERAADGYATIRQDEIMDLLKDKLNRQEIYERRWLDVEPFYRKSGWKVEFDRPGYNESYAAYWTFTCR